MTRVSSDLAIRAEALSRRYGNNLAVDGIDLAVERGEVYGFLGPNGAGKTTTVRMLVTLLAPTSGDAWVMGRSVRDDPGAVRLSIGAALQATALDQQQTGLELLRLQGRLYGLSRRDIDRRLGELRELIDIGDALEQRIRSYSGGMRRRLDLAAALIHDPQVLFLDEPTTGLDPLSRARVWEEVRRLNTVLGTTIFLTTQYLEEADRLAGRVGIISGGHIVAEGSPDELKRRVGDDLVVVRTRGEQDGVVERLRALPHVERVDAHGDELSVASADGAQVVGPVARTLSESGVDVASLTLRTTTLDDVFLELTGNRIRGDEEREPA